MDLLSLMLLSEFNDTAKYYLFMNKIYQKQSYYINREIAETTKNEDRKYKEFCFFFLDHHAVQKSLNRMQMSCNKKNEMILPIFYDHFLSNHWDKFFLDEFLEHTTSINLQLIICHRSHSLKKVPGESFYKGGKTLSRFVKQDLLNSYQSIDGIVKINTQCYGINDPIFLRTLRHFIESYQDYLDDFYEYINDYLVLLAKNNSALKIKNIQ